MGNFLWRGYQNKGGHELKEVVRKAILHLDEKNVFWCNQFSRMHANVWLVCTMSVATATYAFFSVFMIVRLMGRKYFTDNPFDLYSEYLVQPGRMPIGDEGIVLAIAPFTAIVGSLILNPLADIFGRKPILEVSLVIVFFFSLFSAFSFWYDQKSVSGEDAVGSLVFWRAFMGLGLGAIYPTTATIMSEYSSKYSRGAYVSLVFASGVSLGLLLVCGVAAVACNGIGRQFNSGEFPVSIPGVGPVAGATPSAPTTFLYPPCANFVFQSANGYKDDDVLVQPYPFLGSTANTYPSKIVGNTPVTPFPTAAPVKHGRYAGAVPCHIYNQNAYADAINYWNVSESEFIWRATVAGSGFLAIVAFLLSRYLLVESPRYTAHVQKDYQKTITDLALQGEDWTEEAIAAVMRDQENVEDRAEIAPSHQVPDVTFGSFLWQYSWHLWAASSVFSVVQFIFYGQVIVMEPIVKVLGYNKTQGWQGQIDEQFGYAWGWIVLFLVPLVPGLYFTVLTIDAIGHRVLQWVSFIVVIGFLAAAAASKDFLLNPNNANDINGMNSYYPYQRGAWCFLLAATFFFMAWGPLTTIYVITAELFPTKWRCTGYGFVYAAANFFGFIGIFSFLYAMQPAYKAFTYSYPCNRSAQPSDYYPYWNNACKKLNDCPLGRAVPIGNPLLSPCVHCMEGVTRAGQPNTTRRTGCNPFGLGTSGALAIMIPILMYGALFTQLLPVCTFTSLEDINYMNELEGEFLEAKAVLEDEITKEQLERELAREQGHDTRPATVIN